jgi:hypothetical protein
MPVLFPLTIRLIVVFNMKLPQKYGTPMNPDNRATGAFDLYPLEDKSKVNEWRMEVGLPPLKNF